MDELPGNSPGRNERVVKAVADASGNIYVIGDTSGYGTASDFLTIKYRADGAPVWTNRYDGPSHGLDEPRGIAVDASGNVFVTGISRNIISDNVDYLTIKYLADGPPAWTNRYDTTQYDYVSGVVVDKAGNAYVTGTTGHGDKATTIKYRPEGTTAWVGHYRGGFGAYAYAIATDSVGSAYVAGQEHGNGDYQSWFVLKYQSNGLTIWTNRLHSGGGDDAYAIAVDRADNVYVTGASPSGSDKDCLTIKYKPDGTAVWTNRYNGRPNGGDYVQAIEADDAGNTYVTGLSGLTNYSNAGADYATIKYRADGTAAWTNRYDGLGNAFDAAQGLAVDREGNVFVTGRSTGSGTGWDPATIKYRPDGTPAWTNRVNGAGVFSTDSATSVIPAASGDVVVAGTVVNTDGSSDWILYRLAEAPEPNQVSIALLPDFGVRLRFTGVPGQPYQVQRAPSASGPWAVLSTLTAPAHGMIEYIDPIRPPDAAFYLTATP